MAKAAKKAPAKAAPRKVVKKAARKPIRKAKVVIRRARKVVATRRPRPHVRPAPAPAPLVAPVPPIPAPAPAPAPVTGNRFTRFMSKWFGTYKAWTWTALVVIAIILALIGGVLWGIGSAIGSGLYGLGFVVVVVAVMVYHAVRKKMPPTWSIILLICIPIILWGMSVVLPGPYAAWRASDKFYWSIVVMIVLAWLTGYPNNPVARVARFGIIGLVAIAIISAVFGSASNWVTNQTSNQTAMMGTATTPTPAPPTVTEDDVLKTIAQCESGSRQFDADGQPLHNLQGSSAVGLHQIKESVHGEEATRMSYDLHTVEGNTAYARYLVRKNPDLRDWLETEKCWRPKLAAMGASIADPPSVRVVLGADGIIATVGPEWQYYSLDKGGQYIVGQYTPNDEFELDTRDGRETIKFCPTCTVPASLGKLDKIRVRATKEGPQQVWLEVATSKPTQ